MQSRHPLSGVAISADQTVKLSDLYRDHSTWLHARLRKLGQHEPDDLVQETFVHAAGYTASSSSVRNPRALLLTIARNLLRSEYRSSRGRQAASLDDVAEPSVEAEQLEALQLKQMLKALPEIYRDVFLLSRFSGMSYAQIAEARGISVKTVEWRMTRALAMCAATMGD